MCQLRYDPTHMQQALSELDTVFAETRAPSQWARGTCSCAECIEHVQTLENSRDGELPIDAFGNAAWDPMAVANDDAFRFFLPRLFRLAAAHPEYLEQLLFHLTMPGRLDGVTPAQAHALTRALSTLMDTHPTLTQPPLLYRLDEALRLLEAKACTDTSP
jgi:hypothetical protein